MMIGILASMVAFVLTYSKMPFVSVTALNASTVMRPFEERAALVSHRGKIVTISLQGARIYHSLTHSLAHSTL